MLHCLRISHLLPHRVGRPLAMRLPSEMCVLLSTCRRSFSCRMSFLYLWFLSLLYLWFLSLLYLWFLSLLYLWFLSLLYLWFLSPLHLWFLSLLYLWFLSLLGMFFFSKRFVCAVSKLFFLITSLPPSNLAKVSFSTDFGVCVCMCLQIYMYICVYVYMLVCRLSCQSCTQKLESNFYSTWNVGLPCSMQSQGNLQQQTIFLVLVTKPHRQESGQELSVWLVETSFSLWWVLGKLA